MGRTRWSLAMTLGVLAWISGLVAGSPAPANAQTNLEYVGDSWTVELYNGSANLCPDETTTVDVVVRRSAIYWDGEQRVRATRPALGAGGMFALLVTTSDESVIGFESSGFPSGLASFHKLTGRAGEPGTAEITVEAYGTAGIVASATFRTTVNECEYEVHTFSIWHIDAGFQMVAATSVDTEVNRQSGSPGSGTPPFGSQDAEAEHLAVAFPLGGCLATYTKSVSPVQVSAVPNGNYVRFLFEFNQVQMGTEVCHVPGASGGTSGSGTPSQIVFDVSPGGGAWTGAHRVDVDGIGTFTGNFYATIVPIYR